MGLGRTLTVGRNSWHIVGLFEADGSALESELWMDGDLLQTAFRRGGIFQSVLFRAAGSARESAVQFNTLAESDLRPPLRAGHNREGVLQETGKLMADLITILGGILTGIMSVGAIAGAMNTMYAGVSQCNAPDRLPAGDGLYARGRLAGVHGGIAHARRGRRDLGLCGVVGFRRHEDGHDELGDVLRETAFEFLVTPGILATACAALAADGLRRRRVAGLRAARMKVVDALRRA